MHVNRFGTGPRHFLGVHGWNGTGETFRSVIAALPADVTFWTLDLPGCGASPRASKLTLDTVLESAAQALTALPGPVTLVGNCSGAVLGLLLTQAHAGCVNRLVMLDAFAFVPWYFQLFRTQFGRMAYWTAFANPVGRGITNLALRARRTEHTDLTAGFRRADHEATLAYLDIFAEAASLVSFERISTPVDVLYGERTFAAVRESAAIFAEHLPVSRIEVLRGAGHLPLLEATRQVCSILFDPQEMGGAACPPQHSHSPAIAR